MLTAVVASLALITVALPTQSREMPTEFVVIQGPALDAAIDLVGLAAVLTPGREH